MYNIGVHYCGGCNPRYDRVAVVRKLETMLEDVCFDKALAGEEYTAVLVVCGCKSVCARTDDLAVMSDRLIYITGWDCLIEAKERISDLIKKEKEETVLCFDKEMIQNVLPHREPALFLDSAERVVPGKEAKASFLVKQEMEVFKGHFPDRPMLPGVLALEAMAQTADLLILTARGNEGSIPLFAGCSSANFRRPVLPGTQITIYAKAVKVRADMGIYECETKIMAENELCADANIRIILKKIQ